MPAHVGPLLIQKWIPCRRSSWGITVKGSYSSTGRNSWVRCVICVGNESVKLFKAVNDSRVLARVVRWICLRCQVYRLIAYVSLGTWCRIPLMYYVTLGNLFWYRCSFMFECLSKQGFLVRTTDTIGLKRVFLESCITWERHNAWFMVYERWVNIEFSLLSIGLIWYIF